MYDPWIIHIHINVNVGRREENNLPAKKTYGILSSGEQRGRARSSKSLAKKSDKLKALQLIFDTSNTLQFYFWTKPSGWFWR